MLDAINDRLLIVEDKMASAIKDAAGKLYLIPDVIYGKIMSLGDYVFRYMVKRFVHLALGLCLILLAEIVAFFRLLS